MIRKRVTLCVLAFNQNFVYKKKSVSKTLYNWIWENEKVGYCFKNTKNSRILKNIRDLRQSTKTFRIF